VLLALIHEPYLSRGTLFKQLRSLHKDLSQLGKYYDTTDDEIARQGGLGSQDAATFLDAAQAAEILMSQELRDVLDKIAELPYPEPEPTGVDLWIKNAAEAAEAADLGDND
jgi:hypothetical protein